MGELGAELAPQGEPEIQTEERQLTHHEELLQAGVSHVQASRMAVNASLRQVVRGMVPKKLAMVWFAVTILGLLGLGGLLFWSQAVYQAHKEDECDEPFALMLKLIWLLVAGQIIHRKMAHKVLCYNAERDGPVEPCRVQCFKYSVLSLALVWPIAAGVMLGLSHDCNRELKRAVLVLCIYYLVLSVVMIGLPGLLLMVLMFLIREDLISLPRSPGGAPEHFIDTMETVLFDPETMTGEAHHCAVCLKDFCENREIKKTHPCGHNFHRDCLDRWLKVARTCPLCRLELCSAPVGDGDDDDDEAEAGPRRRRYGPRRHRPASREGLPLRRSSRELPRGPSQDLPPDPSQGLPQEHDAPPEVAEDAPPEVAD